MEIGFLMWDLCILLNEKIFLVYFIYLDFVEIEKEKKVNVFKFYIM